MTWARPEGVETKAFHGTWKGSAAEEKDEEEEDEKEEEKKEEVAEDGGQQWLSLVQSWTRTKDKATRKKMQKSMTHSRRLRGRGSSCAVPTMAVCGAGRTSRRVVFCFFLIPDRATQLSSELALLEPGALGLLALVHGRAAFVGLPGTRRAPPLHLHGSQARQNQAAKCV
jgi:hypothetical protein